MNEQYIERYWRDAKPADAIKEPPMMARFRYEDAEDWEYDLLVGWDRTDQCHWRSELDAFEHCQVYDAPDPGEGWRLVDVEKEQPMDGDEVYTYDKRQDKWIIRTHKHKPYNKELIYRRRIEPPKPKYERFRWEDREHLRGRWIASNDGRYERLASVMYHEEGNFYVNSINAISLCADWHFLDTGEPVGERVE